MIASSKVEVLRLESFWNFDNSRTLCSLQSKVIWPVNDFSYILNYYVIKAISQFISFWSILPLISFHFYKSLQHWHEWWVLWVETKKEVCRNKNGCSLGVVSTLVVQVIIQKKVYSCFESWYVQVFFEHELALMVLYAGFCLLVVLLPFLNFFPSLKSCTYEKRRL